MKLYRYCLITALLSICIASLPALADNSNSNKPGEAINLSPASLKTTIEGFVLDESGSGVSGVEIVVPQKSLTVKTSHSGYYKVVVTGKGALHIEAYKSGYLPASTDMFKLGSGSILTIPKLVLQKSPLEEVVVTGTATPKLYRETPVKTAVASKLEIEKKGAVSLADSLEIMTGVRVEDNCQNCNFTQVRINGMEGKYSQILVNGLPVVSALAGVYLLEQVPANMIDKLEVVKGGGSALYGGNAVAGVVNVITKEPQKSGSRFSLMQEAISGAPNSVLNFNTDYVSKNLNTAATFYTNYQRRQAMDYDDDDFSDLGELTNLSIGSKFNHYFNTINGKLKASFNVIIEDRRGGNKLDQPEHFADIAESIRTRRADLGIGWEQTLDTASTLKFEGSFSYTKRNSYYGAEQDPNAYGSTTNPVFYGTLVYTNMQDHRHGIVAGVSFRSDSIKDLAPAYNRVIDETYTDLGLFIQDEIELIHDKASLLVGVRGDKHSEVEKMIFSPRASLLYNGLKNLTVRATYSTGFRAPQVFDEDLHITQVGGEGQLIVNREGLNEEKSSSFTIGFDYGKSSVNRLYQFSLNGFYNRLNGAFALEEIEPQPNARVFERFNSEGASVYGIEVEAGYKAAGKFEFFTGWTFQTSRLDEPEPDFNSKKMFRSPDVYGSARLDITLGKLGNLRTEMSYTGSMKVPHFAGYIDEDRLEESPSFTVFNLSFSKTLGKSNRRAITLTGSVYNIFDRYQKDLDKGVYRDAGYIYGPRLPRTFRLGLRYSF